jgi:CHAT domain-containing protein
LSAYEARRIGKTLGNVRMVSGATRNDVKRWGREANIFHYTGHANFNGLVLHREDGEGAEDYFLEDMYDSLSMPNCHLAVLSACETGVINEVRAVDEYIGLPSAFLIAGARTVISSLWCVNDVSTALMMEKMYEFIKEGKGKAEALCKAQRWLKDPVNRQEQIERLNTSRAEMMDVLGFDLISEGSMRPEDMIPADLDRPYHWAGFICSGTG